MTVADKKYLEATYDTLVTALGEPCVQEALKITGGEFNKYNTFGIAAKSIVDSAYNITTEIFAMQRISQSEKNQQQLSLAMQKLKDRMDKLGKELDTQEADLKVNFQCKSAP